MSPSGYQPPVIEAKSVRGKKIRQGENWVVRKGNYLSLNFLNTGGSKIQRHLTSWSTYPSPTEGPSIDFELKLGLSVN